MKRKILCLVLAAAAMLAVCVSTAFAESQLDYVVDAAGLLNEAEWTRLEQMAQIVSSEYTIGVYIVTVDDYRNYGSGDVFETTYEIYHTYTMGEGENRDGIILLLSMEDRDYAMFCYGERSEYAFNEYGQAELEKVFLDNFSENDWYGGFTDYIRACASYLQAAAAGQPVRRSPAGPIKFVTCLALFIALLAVGFIWSRMNNTGKQKTANAYISDELNLTGKTDTFTYRTETRRKIESSSGGGSRSRFGGGGSGRSGKF